MRQRLPGREVGRAAGGQQRVQRGGQLLGLAGGGGDGQDEPARGRRLPGSPALGGAERAGAALAGAALAGAALAGAALAGAALAGAARASAALAGAALAGEARASAALAGAARAAAALAGERGSEERAERGRPDEVGACGGGQGGMAGLAVGQFERAP